MTWRSDAASLSAQLAARAPDLAAALLPAGRREGAEWRCGSLAGEPGRSLAVRLSGPRAGVWADFASGEAGDALDLVAAVRFRGDRRLAMAWARAWLGLGATAAPDGTPRQAPAHHAERATHRDLAARRARAVALFESAPPGLSDTPAGAHLRGRGIDLATLGRQPCALRCHSSLWNAEARRAFPAMLAAISGPDGAHVATHRTWLARDRHGSWAKAPLQMPRMTLGAYAGGAVHLWRGAGDRPLAQAEPGEAVALAEGLETALSVALACPELRVLSAVSLANMGRVVLPQAVRIIVLCADNDGDNAAARRGLGRAVSHFAAQGREVRVARSPIGKDFNDCLRADAEFGS